MGYSPWNRRESDLYTQTRYHPTKIENILLTVILSFGGGGCAGSLLLCRLFSVVMSMDYSPVVVCRPLLVVHSLVVEHGL